MHGFDPGPLKPIEPPLIIVSLNFFAIEDADDSTRLELETKGVKFKNWPLFIDVLNSKWSKANTIFVENTHYNETPVKPLYETEFSEFGFWRIKYKSEKLC